MSDETVFCLVCSGDTLSRLAARHGFNAERTWALPQNGELRRERESGEHLQPGDKLYYLAPQQHPPPVNVAGSNSYGGTVLTQTSRVRFVLGARRLSDLACKITLVGPSDANSQRTESSPGRTSSDGTLTLQVPHWSIRAIVEFPTLNLKVALDVRAVPPSDDEGMLGRMFQLGYDDDIVAEGEAVTDRFERAVLSFQADNQRPATGNLEDEDRRLLIQRRGA